MADFYNVFIEDIPFGEAVISFICSESDIVYTKTTGLIYVYNFTKPIYDMFFYKNGELNLKAKYQDSDFISKCKMQEYYPDKNMALVSVYNWQFINKKEEEKVTIKRKLIDDCDWDLHSVIDLLHEINRNLDSKYDM